MLIGTVVPDLKPHEGSWVVTHQPSGEVREFQRDQRSRVEHFAANTNFKIETIGNYLSSLNS